MSLKAYLAGGQATVSLEPSLTNYIGPSHPGREGVLWTCQLKISDWWGPGRDPPLPMARPVDEAGRPLLLAFGKGLERGLCCLTWTAQRSRRGRGGAD